MSVPDLANGAVRLLTKQLPQPNGLAFSPDEKRLYVDDDVQLNIWVFDFHPNGTISTGRVFGSEFSSSNNAVPDGMKMDMKAIYTSSARKASGCGVRRDGTWEPMCCLSSPPASPEVAPTTRPSI